MYRSHKGFLSRKATMKVSARFCGSSPVIFIVFRIGILIGVRQILTIGVLQAITEPISRYCNINHGRNIERTRLKKTFENCLTAN